MFSRNNWLKFLVAAHKWIINNSFCVPQIDIYPHYGFAPHELLRPKNVGYPWCCARSQSTPPFSVLFDFNTEYSQKGFLRAVLPVREKTIGVIAIVQMCENCSHFRLMLAVEETKIAQPETREKYFVYYKENFERPPRGNTLKLTRVMWKSKQTSIICCCLFKRRI